MRPLEIIIIADGAEGRHRDEWPGLVTEKVSIVIDDATRFRPKHRAEIDS